MLLLCILLGCCLSGSMGSAIEEFQVNLKAVVAQVNEEVFLPVPAGKFQCSNIPCHLERTIEWLKGYFKNDQVRTRISLMEKNAASIVSTLSKARTKPDNIGSCPMAWKPPQSALKRYRRFFQKLHESC